MIKMARSVAQQIETHRKNWLKRATTPLQIQFGNDPRVARFVLDLYKHQKLVWMGNAPDISESDYWEFATLLTDKYNFDIMCENLEMDEATKLLATAKALRKIYGRMKLP